MVHRLGGLVLSGHSRVDPRFSDRAGNRLVFNPCIPPEWSHVEITYRFRSAIYSITVENPGGAESGVDAVWLDNARQARHGHRLLTDDGKNHEVRSA